MKDNRSTIIKRALKTAFPSSTFKIKIEKYAGGESINIWSDYMLPYLPHTDGVWRVGANANPTQSDYDEWRKYNERNEENKKRREEIERVINGLNEECRSKIHYDEVVGEILQGWNRFVFVDAMFSITQKGETIKRC